MVAPEPFTPLARITFAAEALLAEHPPRFRHRNKQAILERIAPPGSAHRGEIVVSRWSQRLLPLAQRWGAATPWIDLRPDTFPYDEAPAGRVAWTLNFAHSSLFIAYGGPLFAQDEMQVMEHPALASVREALQARDDPRLRPLTREHGVATPVLLRGVERRCAIATDVDPDADRPHGLYGNAFARASAAAVLRATRPLEPPTLSNILAIEAPEAGFGRYTLEQIHDALSTAYTGFAAARAESIDAAGDPEVEVEIHSGHWGTGAYGGHRVLMAMLQFLAAKAAGIDRFVFHTVTVAALEPCREALTRLAGLEARPLGEAIEAIEAMGFLWGVSDGN
ncbi:MAG: hypothetical protein R3B09_06105 [Nannocystaceae bacterium]